MNLNRKSEIADAINAVGEILASQDESASIVIVGGTALIIQNIVNRTTKDVDIIAIGSETWESESGSIKSPEPLPDELIKAVSRVARDFNLPEDWMNTAVGLQWKTGLPPGFENRIHWQKTGGLWLGIADRYDLIFLKLYAAADSEGPSSVHYQDLVALKPSQKELDAAEKWVKSQDPSTGFALILTQVLEHLEKHG